MGTVRIIVMPQNKKKNTKKYSRIRPMAQNKAVMVILVETRGGRTLTSLTGFPLGKK